MVGARVGTNSVVLVIAYEQECCCLLVAVWASPLEVEGGSRKMSSAGCIVGLTLGGKRMCVVAFAAEICGVCTLYYRW